jgi:hypothetical protein
MTLTTADISIQLLMDVSNDGRVPLSGVKPEARLP